MSLAVTKKSQVLPSETPSTPPQPFTLPYFLRGIDWLSCTSTYFHGTEMTAFCGSGVSQNRGEVIVPAIATPIAVAAVLAESTKPTEKAQAILVAASKARENAEAVVKAAKEVLLEAKAKEEIARTLTTDAIIATYEAQETPKFEAMAEATKNAKEARLNIVTLRLEAQDEVEIAELRLTKAIEKEQAAKIAAGVPIEHVMGIPVATGTPATNQAFEDIVLDYTAINKLPVVLSKEGYHTAKEVKSRGSFPRISAFFSGIARKWQNMPWSRVKDFFSRFITPQTTEAKDA